ncbi:uncharacterized protein knl1 isoform X2 [Sebastes fasciatus]|uniref:uncharacterized protein knl1 isoform X2 n=1 Tax=Sebastes fasciatus TaxID=394691 RepID=UPI003D9E165C
MEPLDPAKNDEGGGFSRRRISSILKAPRKSIIFPDPQQQENVVECAKPVEKRISRRVSFAPANDVLLFSKDVKNASPVRSPLQELITTTTATQNRVQVAVTEDGSQQITGMETLLNAPLHASQQRDKVNFDTRDDVGEETVMFSTDDVFMDMTQSHTINIANDAESRADISSLPTRGEKTVMFTANDGSTVMRNVSSSAPSLDTGFENIIASLSKPSGPSVNPVITRMMPAAGASSEETTGSLAQIKTQRVNVDKENQAPASVSAVMAKSLNTSRKIGEFYGSALCLEDDSIIDMTEAQTGHTLGSTDDDPFQCLFPTQEMYSHHDNRASQTAEKTTQQQISKPLASFNTKDMTSSKNPSLHASHQRHKVNLDTKDDCRNKTIMFTAGDEFMDMTQSHMVNIASGSSNRPNQNLDILHTRGKMDNASSLEERKRETCGTPGSSANGLDLGFKNFVSSLSKPGSSSGNPAIVRVIPPTAASSKETVDTSSSLSQLKSNVGKEKQSLNTTRSFGGSFNERTICPENDVSMDMTEAQTGRIIGLTGSDDSFQFLFPTQDTYAHSESLEKKEVTSGRKNRDVLGSSNRTGMETSLTASLKTKVQRHEVMFDAEDDSREKTVRFTADDAGMDVTRSHTVNIATDFEPQLRQSVDILPACGEKTVRFTADDAGMDVTRSHTVNIATALQLQSRQNVDLLPACGEKTVRFTADDAGMDVTRSHTVNIATDFEPQSHQNVDLLPACGEKTVRFTADDAGMDVTRSHTVNIATDFEPQLRQSVDILPACGEKTVRFTADDAGMDVTRSHTVNIATALQLQSRQNVDLLPACGEKTVRFTADDAGMDVTRSHTVNIATDFEPQSHQNVDLLPACGEKTVRFTADDAGMDVTRSHTVNIATDFEPQLRQSVDILPACGEKTVRFTADDAGMDVTRSHTVNIATALQLQSRQNVDLLPACGEKTVRFTADDAGMDVTRSHTVNIATDFEPQSHQNVDPLPACGEKTVRFTADDAGMDVTRSHTVNIATDFEPQLRQNGDFLPACGEKTMRFTATDAAMDVTRSHTVNIATDFEPQSHQNVDPLPACGEKTMRFTATDAGMDMTQCLTVDIPSNSVSDSLLPHRDSNISSTHENIDFPVSAKKTHRPCRNRSSSAQALDPGFKKSLSRASGPWANPVINKAVAPAAPSPQETVDTNGFLDQLKTQRADVDTEKEGFVSAVMEKPVNKTMTEGPEDDVSMDMTEAQTGRILRQTYTDEPPQCLSPTQDLHPNSDHLKKTELTPQQSNEALGSSNPDGVEITSLPDSLETGTRKEPEPRNLTLSQKMESSPSAVDHDVDAAPSRKARRRSLANLQSKVRRLSHKINTALDTIAMDSCTAPLPRLERNMDKNSNDKTEPLPVTEPELEMGLVNTEEDTQAQCLMQEEQPSTTTATPFNLKTQQLMSRLSVGSFKAKLPRRSKPDVSKKVNSVREHTQTVNVTKQLSNFDDDLSNIHNEELGSYEDASETLDMSPQKATEEVSASPEFNMEELLEDNAIEQDFINAVHGKKRSLPVDENILEDEKRMKTSTEATTDVETSHVVECDGNITAAPGMITQSTDYSNSSHTARYETTFESTFKQSLCEDYTTDIQRKLDDGTITVLEFFKLFNIDFVIHNPRQSILPGRPLSETDHTPMDLLKDRYINRPKQMVYETDVLNLTEKVEGLKERMWDLDKPLKIVNRPLWEEVRNASEKEITSLGAKLKERNSLFRKSSKVQSHEMKEVLYSNLVQANLEEQQTLRGTIEEADEMMKSLDDCIRELETELAAVEEKGYEDKPSLKSRQEEMQKVTEALADNDRQISELEIQKKQNSNKLNRLKAETRNLESHVTVQNMVNEWKFAEKRDNCTVYSFLHETLHLQLVYEKTNGNDADNQSERKISHITFKLQLDDEKSHGHACLVHKLLSRYIEGESDLVEKYPTSRHVPQLLQEVGLVVSRCRLLGEELRLLKMWGGVRLDILDISCVDTRVHIVFSRLKTLSKFEVIFSVSLIDRLCVLQVHSFKNMIGNTTIQQIEEIVASFSPAKNVLTKIVKKIHENLLC